MIEIGIVGAGKIVETFHLPAWAAVPDARVMAICDPRIDAAQQLASRFGIDKVYSSVEAMVLDAGLEAVDICSPHRLHHAHAVLALEAGLHCLIEKPFATSAADAQVIADLARARNRVVMCAQHQRFRPPSMLLKRMIEAGDLGEIYCVRVDAMSARGVPRQVRNSFTDALLSDGGPLMDQGSHGIDIAWWLMGCPRPLTAYAMTSNVTVPPAGRTPDGAEWDVYSVEDFATGILTFADNRAITIHTSYYANCREDRFGCEIFGTLGGAVWPDLIVTRPAGNGVTREIIQPVHEHKASVEELRHFSSLIRNAATPVVPLEESVQLVTMLEALYRSAETGDVTRLR
jgi:predicted dehydrogenase